MCEPKFHEQRTYQEFQAMTPDEVFWHLIERMPSGCWEWRGTVSRLGYGRFYYPRYRSHRVNRIALQIALGRELSSEEHVLHRCDNPPCCNPEHLWVGTVYDNIQDRVQKGRSARGANHRSKLYPELVPRGSAHGMAKHTEDEIISVKVMLADGLTHRQIETITGVGRSTVSKISRGIQWSHVLVTEGVE